MSYKKYNQDSLSLSLSPTKLGIMRSFCLFVCLLICTFKGRPFPYMRYPIAHFFHLCCSTEFYCIHQVDWLTTTRHHLHPLSNGVVFWAFVGICHVLRALIFSDMILCTSIFFGNFVCFFLFLASLPSSEEKVKFFLVFLPISSIVSLAGWSIVFIVAVYNGKVFAS